jgi:hypothetical protein
MRSLHWRSAGYLFAGTRVTMITTGSDPRDDRSNEDHPAHRNRCELWMAPCVHKVIAVIEVSGNRLPSGFALIKVGKGAGSTSGW